MPESDDEIDVVGDFGLSRYDLFPEAFELPPLEIPAWPEPQPITAVQVVSPTPSKRTRSEISTSRSDPEYFAKMQAEHAQLRSLATRTPDENNRLHRLTSRLGTKRSRERRQERVSTLENTVASQKDVIDTLKSTIHQLKRKETDYKALITELREASTHLQKRNLSLERSLEQVGSLLHSAKTVVENACSEWQETERPKPLGIPLPGKLVTGFFSRPVEDVQSSALPTEQRNPRPV